MKRRILLVDDEVAILLTLKAVLEMSDFEVETAASAREAKLKLRVGQYHMVITDMRMESETAGKEVVAAARKARYKPAVTMLTAFPEPAFETDPDGADKMLVKPMHTGDLIRQLEALLVAHEDKKRKEKEKDDRRLAVAPRRRKPAAQKAAASARKPAVKSLPAQKNGRKSSTPKLAKAR
ncbi:MAG TPA: response regulator [Acidobacteriaceae bacterium]|nr:response regulator [Acidobacteriaceae bacterium]